MINSSPKSPGRYFAPLGRPRQAPSAPHTPKTRREPPEISREASTHGLHGRQGSRQTTRYRGREALYTSLKKPFAKRSDRREYPKAYRFNRKSRRGEGQPGMERPKYHKPISKTPLPESMQLAQRNGHKTGYPQLLVLSSLKNHGGNKKAYCNICTKRGIK